MEKEFVPYEQALVLKELGFDERCFGYYKEKQYELHKEFHCYNSDYVEHLSVYISAPTYSQAFRWFREKYDHISCSHFNRITGYRFELSLDGGDSTCSTKSFKTYEEAELECLKKLIEIVKQK